MKRIASVLLAATCFAILPAVAQGDLEYSAADILKLPQGMYFGEVAGVATNSKGHIFVYQHAGSPTASTGGSRTFVHGGDQLLEFDATGKYVREIGKGNYGFLSASSVRVDAHDNIWAVDRYSGIVIEFSPDGSRIVMLLGRKPESVNITPEGAGRGGRGGRVPGAGGSQDVFTGAADVAWDAAGNIFVADGFGGNTRVAKFSPQGVFLKSFGKTGSDNDSFASPRSLAVDGVGNVYVADHGNKRIQVLDNNLGYKSSITGVGDPAAICIKGDTLYASNSNPVDDLDSGGEIYRLTLAGNVTAKFGRAGKAAKEFGTVNQIDCRMPNTLLTAEIGNYRAQKITLKP